MGAVFGLHAIGIHDNDRESRSVRRVASCRRFFGRAIGLFRAVGMDDGGKQNQILPAGEFILVIVAGCQRYSVQQTLPEQGAFAPFRSLPADRIWLAFISGDA